MWVGAPGVGPYGGDKQSRRCPSVHVITTPLQYARCFKRPAFLWNRHQAMIQEVAARNFVCIPDMQLPAFMVARLPLVQGE